MQICKKCIQPDTKPGIFFDENGICGACTIHINGRASRSCLTLAVQADGCNINTIESISNNDKNLSIIQKNFKIFKLLYLNDFIKIWLKQF